MMHKNSVRMALLAMTAWSAGPAFAQSAVNWNSLVMSGEANPRPWCGQWWGHRSNGIAVNAKENPGYGDALSPAEKLDKLTGRLAKIEYDKVDTWLSCALKSWQECNGRGASDRWKCLQEPAKREAYRKCTQGFSIDTAFEYEVVNHGKGAYGYDSWWGHCNAWAAAAVLFPEPTKAVDWQGIKWTVADAKGLLTEVLMDVDLAADGWAGCRYDGPGNTRTYPGTCDTEQDALNDVTPRQYLNMMSKHIGTNRHGVVIDRYTGDQVWNQPVWKYDVTGCTQSTGAPCGAGEKKYTCQTSFTWAEDGVGHNEVCQPPHGYTTRSLGFFVCVDSTNNIRPERSKMGWIVPSGVAESDRNPDFIWVPAKLSSYPDSSNPYVFREYEKIKTIAAMSAGPQGQPPTPGTAKSYKKTVNKAIPDNSPAGISVSWRFTSSYPVKAAALCVNITHTYRGDLLIKLKGPNGKEEILWKNQGGATDNITDECVGTTSFLNSNMKGTWTATVADTARGDTGTWNHATLKITR